jgi:hypothetical protein
MSLEVPKTGSMSQSNEGGSSASSGKTVQMTRRIWSICFFHSQGEESSTAVSNKRGEKCKKNGEPMQHGSDKESSMLHYIRNTTVKNILSRIRNTHGRTLTISRKAKHGEIVPENRFGKRSKGFLIQLSIFLTEMACHYQMRR